MPAWAIHLEVTTKINEKTKFEDKKKNITPPPIPIKEKKIPNFQLPVDNDEIENEKWFSNSEDLRRAIINNEILSRKFNI